MCICWNIDINTDVEEVDKCFLSISDYLGILIPRGRGPRGARRPGPSLELGIYRVNFLKISKISFFLLIGPPLGKNHSSVPEYSNSLAELPMLLLLPATHPIQSSIVCGNVSYWMVLLSSNISKSLWLSSSVKRREGGVKGKNFILFLSNISKHIFFLHFGSKL